MRFIYIYLDTGRGIPCRIRPVPSSHQDDQAVGPHLGLVDNLRGLSLSPHHPPRAGHEYP